MHMPSGGIEIDEIMSLIRKGDELVLQCLFRDRHRIERSLDQLKLFLAQQRTPGEKEIQSIAKSFNDASRRLEARTKSIPNPDFPASLPVSERCEEIVNAIQNHQVVIIAGETGSGKTTQIPKMCLSAGRGKRGMIACTQPRRVAALSISKRVAEEMHCRWGQEVGCKIRFNDETSSRTLIKFMTDGMLLAEAQSDSMLSQYDTIIIDEAHERSLNIDFILGFLRLLVEKRPDLKIIITSATIDTEAFSKAFNNAPIIEVSGKVYPVDVLYQPWQSDAETDDESDYDFIDAAVDAVDSVLDDPVPGDVLVFMPGERDIRETKNLMESRFGPSLDILPLFGRLTAAEQQRIFSESDRRRVVIATNIAETSLTIPNIRFVVDSGLARISRYSPRTRTKRLPIEGISQSSANQRKGRCGRIADGICIRLYSEEEFLERPAYTQPELQRCNLAEVILRMKAFGLGDMDSFPFLNPPQDNAIKNGYKLLQELDAIDEFGDLTELGDRMARLPLDPMISRMVIQANEEEALREVIIIAAGLSIQDPRERPMDNEKAADTAHQVFKHENSDFLTLLNLWNYLKENGKKLKTQSQLRKFCKKNFISFIRYREWKDIHFQLETTIKDLGGFSFNSTEPSEDAIHRAILTGLIIQSGSWVEKNWYKSPGNRKTMVFPGSVIFQSSTNRERRKKSKVEAIKTDRAGQPKWIVAGEFLETSQLFARNVAKIRPEWILEFGSHLCQFSYFDPRYDRKSGRVLIKQKVSLKGLEILTRSIDMKNVEASDATEIFIREALISEESDLSYPFLDHNQGIIDQVQTWQRRVRDVSFSRLEEKIFDFYYRKFDGVFVSSIHDFNKQLKKWYVKNPDHLFMSMDDLTQGTSLELDHSRYPEKLSCAGHIVEIQYAYAPGEENDGVTMQLPAALSHKVTQSVVDWLVPGYRKEKVENLIRLLPRQYRKELMPVADIADQIVESLKPVSRTINQDLTLWVQQNKGIDIPPALWEIGQLPEFLRVKVSIVDSQGKVQFKGYDISEFQHHIKNQSASLHKERAIQIIRKFEKHAITHWDFGDLPEEVEIATPGSPTAWVYPGFYLENNQVHVRVFKSIKDSRKASIPAYRQLAALALSKDMLWLEKDLDAIRESKLYAVSFMPLDDIIADATQFCLRCLFPSVVLWPLKQSQFERVVQDARVHVSKLGRKVAQKTNEVLKLRHELSLSKDSFPPVHQELIQLVPKNFMRNLQNMENLSYLPRSLKARKIRWERALSNPQKDQSKWDRVEPWIRLQNKWAKNPIISPQAKQYLSEFTLLVEEYYITLFAQELGSRKPVSENKLREFVEKSCEAGYLTRSKN